ncbi:MAG: PAS domain S-box protein [Leeuwenhoekiella sp.]|uniref:PAS domain-containing hybrid sensor histidine kinase/response regulator n=1 Tax=Leeuwenhoekiella TaxID=283735 RepID=UPI000EDA9EE9|nr:PAS domain S-box protein [Leeuwenhoekiella blandensis]HCW64793.1 hybrid sensor histidine kinase/response regulator [Leeuwenhoekiella sp.]|tara:strand:+ start:191 stop:3808 length:3618 start_codon:yes stop_codon:yes gene_type:complete
MSDSAFVKRDFHRILCDDAEVFSWILSKASIGVFYINLEHQERFHITTSFWDTIGYRKPEKEVELDVFWEVLGVAGKKTIQDLINKTSFNELTKERHYFSFSDKNRRILTATSRHLVYTDSDGKRHLFVKFIADVAQKSSSDNYLKKIKKLRKFNEIYEETNDLACVGGWEVDLIKNTVTWTRVTKEIHGVPKKYKPCLETGINFYKEGENRKRITALFTKCMEQGESFDDEFIIITADGKEKWVRSMGKAEFENGVCIRVYGAFQDISNRKKHQLAREKAENRFTKVFENSSIGIVLVNQQSNLVMANPSARRIFGLNHLSEEEVLKYTIKDVLLPEYIPQALENRTALLSGKIDHYQMEVECYHGSGKIIWCNLSCSMITEAEARSKLVITQVEDITKRKSLERRALENASKFKRVFEYSPNGMALVDLHGRWRSVNHNLAQMIGYTREELLQKSLSEITHPDDRENDAQLFSKIITKELTNYQIEKRYLHKNGSVVHCFLTVSGLFDEHGNVRSLIGQVVDMTDEIHAKRALQESLNEMRVILDSTTQVIIVETDLDHVIKKFNKGAENLLGYEAEEVIGKQKPAIFHKDQEVEDYALKLKEEYGEQVDKHDVFTYKINRGELETSDWTYVRKDGTTFPVQLVVTAIKDDEGKTTGYLGVSADISALKAMEYSLIKAKQKAEAANKYKSEFLANMSHEIRTPLNGVIGFADILMKSQLNENQQKYMETIYASAISLLDLINDILDFSKIEAGKLSLSEERVNITELCGRSVEMIKHEAYQKNIEVLLNIPRKIDQFIIADGLRLRQILINLLSNAVKFTHDGEIELKVEEQNSALHPNKKQFTFSLRDTGIGISEQNLQEIFKAFNQGDASTTRKYGGTGLGLTISNRLLQLMESKLEVRSTLGVGTTFSFTVDFETDSSISRAARPFKDIKRALIVDDNTNNRVILEEMLSERSIETVHAANGIDALELLQQDTNFDIAIVDYNMPYLNGLDLIQHFREDLNIDKEQLPVILLHSSEEDTEINGRTKALGVAGKLVKPALRNDLFETIDRLDESDHGQLEEAQETTDLSNGTLSILVAEDNPVNKFLTKTILNKITANATIIEADDGAQAVEVYKNQQLDFIFMDIQMPVMSGYEATQEIRKLEPHGDHIPIIALTARALKGEHEKCVASGMDGYIAKPLVLEDLKKVLQEHLNNEKLSVS